MRAYQDVSRLFEGLGEIASEEGSGENPYKRKFVPKSAWLEALVERSYIKSLIRHNDKFSEAEFDKMSLVRAYFIYCKFLSQGYSF